jgi:hypothetical protein
MSWTCLKSASPDCLLKSDKEINSSVTLLDRDCAVDARASNV